MDKDELEPEQHNLCREIDAKLIDSRRARNNYWSVLMRLSSLYKSAGSPGDDFESWVRDQFGFEILRDGWDMYTAEYKVVDDRKFLLFRLKYGL